jgi:hypothetical protein
MADSITLAKRMAPLLPPFAEQMRSVPTKITPYQTDCLKQGVIYHSACNGKYGPSLMTVGLAEPNFTVLLAENPDGFYQLAAKVGLVLDTPERRNRYVWTFLDTTKSMSVRTQFLTKFPELRRTPETTPEDLERFQALKDKFGSVVQKLNLSAQEPWKGKAFALVLWDLVQYEVTLTPTGQITIAKTVLEKEMPLCLDLATASN